MLPVSANAVLINTSLQTGRWSIFAAFASAIYLHHMLTFARLSDRLNRGLALLANHTFLQ